MAEVRWIKVVTNIFDDEKIRYIETMPNGDETIVIWFRLMCLAGKSNSDGWLVMTGDIYYTDELLASIFNRDIKSIQLALSVFEKLNMIVISDHKIGLSNWDKYQNIEGLDKLKEQNRIRVQRFRDKNKISLDSNALGNITSNAKVMLCNGIEVDKESDKEVEKEKASEGNKGKSSRFTPPSLDEVRDYIKMKDLKHVDAKTFISYYESVGWMVGKKKMVSWKASLSGWDARHTSEDVRAAVGRSEPIPDYDADRSTEPYEGIEALKERIRLLGIKQNGQ